MTEQSDAGLVPMDSETDDDAVAEQNSSIAVNIATNGFDVRAGWNMYPVLVRSPLAPFLSTKKPCLQDYVDTPLNSILYDPTPPTRLATSPTTAFPHL